MNPLKLVLLAVGGYFLIKATGLSLPGFGTSTQPDDATSTGATGGGVEMPPPSAGLVPAASVAEALIYKAAGGDAAAAAQTAAAGTKFSADVWNWYREQETGQPTTVDLFTDPDNRGELMDAPEYLRRRTSAGLAGLAAVVAGVRYGY